MGLKITKDSASGGMGSMDKLTEEDKTDYIKIAFALAKKHALDYGSIKEEIQEYDVELPHKVDLPDLSNMNKLYAVAQDYMTRVTNLEREAISNLSRWQKVFIALKSLLNEKEADLYTEEDIMNLPNARIQEAAVRKRLKKIHSNVERVRSCVEEAKGFVEILKAKRQDLSSVLMNLNRQVKTLSVERQKTY